MLHLVISLQALTSSELQNLREKLEKSAKATELARLEGI